MRKWLVIGALAVIALMVAAIAAAPRLLATSTAQAYVAQLAARALGRPVTYASLSISAFPAPAVRLTGLAVGEDPAFGPGSFLTASEGRIGLRWRPLLSGRVEPVDLTFDGLHVDLIEDARGRLNVASLAAPPVPGLASPRAGSRPGGGAAGSLIVPIVRIVNGSVRYTKIGGHEPVLTLEKIEAAIQQRAPGGPIALRGDTVAEPGGLHVSLKEASLTPIAGRSPGEMPLKATVDLQMDDVAPLAATVLGSLTASGPLKGRLEVEGTPSRVMANGVLALDRLVLSAQRPQCGEPARRQLLIESMRLPLTAGPIQVDSAPLTATVARGSLSLHAVVTFRPAVLELTQVAARAVELGPVLVDFLCHPYAISGALDLDGGMRLTLDDPLNSAGGTGRVRIGRGRIVGHEIASLVREAAGLGSTVAALARRERPQGASVLDFDSITATYSISGGVVRTDDLLYRARDVTVRGRGTYGLSDSRVAMDMTLSQGANQVNGFVSGAPGSLRLVPTGVKILDGRDVKKFLDRLLR
jgi:hypothetical protein